MAWSLRKSFKVGPTRINLSSRGIGYSVGVRGLRVGTSSSGRGYVRGGRGMLRYQAALGSSAQSLAGPPAYSGPAFGGCRVSMIGGLILGPVLLAIQNNTTRLIVAGSVVALVLVAMGLRKAAAMRREREEAARQEAIEALNEAVSALLTNPTPSEADARRVSERRREVGELPGGVEQYEAAYRSAVADAVADQKVSPEERTRLERLARGLGLSRDFVQRSNLGGFVEGFYALIGDGKLTEDEDEKLKALRAAFSIPEAQITAQLAKADQLRRARGVEQADKLEPVAVDVKLGKSESAFYAVPAAEMRFYMASDRDFEPVKSGTLYVTDQRLLFVGDGSNSIKLQKVLRLGMEPRRAGGEVVSLAIDGRKTPYYLFADEPFVLVAHIKRAWGAAHNAPAA